jgi:hypothetical protein
MTGLVLDEFSGFRTSGVLDKVPDLAFWVTEPGERAQIRNVGKEHCRPFDGVRLFPIGHVTRYLGAVERDLLMRAITKWFVSRMAAPAESILLWNWIGLSGPIVYGFALGIGCNPLLTERHTTAHDVRAIFGYFDRGALVLYLIHGRSLFSS